VRRETMKTILEEEEIKEKNQELKSEQKIMTTRWAI